MPGFTPKMQSALCHYIKHRNKTAAYRHAYNTENMLTNTVYRAAVELFDKPLMKSALSQMQAHAESETKIDAAWVLKRAGLLANFNIKSFIEINEDGKPFYNFKNATDDDWYCLSEYTDDSVTRLSDNDELLVSKVKIKSHCKLKALELVAKHTDVKALDNTINHNGVLGVAQLTTDEYKKARNKMLLSDDI